MLTGLLAGLLQFLSGGIVDKVLGHLEAKANTETERERIRTEASIEAIKAEVEAQRSGRDIIIAEQGRWYTAAVRPLLAAPVIIYLWKVIVFDKVLGLGSTDPIDGVVAEWAGAIVTTYVGGRTIEKVASILKSRMA